jgi:hypothetical protein
MGGIVVKEVVIAHMFPILFLTPLQAIVTTLVKGVMYENIRNSCLGIIFLATPHRGSTVLGFPKLVAAIANIPTIVTSRFVGRAKTELLNNLEREAPVLDSINGKFVDQTGDRPGSIKVATFVEMNVTPPSSDRVT